MVLLIYFPELWPIWKIKKGRRVEWRESNLITLFESFLRKERKEF